MSFIVNDPIDRDARTAELLPNPSCGASVTFEGWVRDHNEGKPVTGLVYEAYTTLAESEMARIICEAEDNFAVEAVRAVHRVGDLKIGEIAVWVGAVSAHRDAAFDACRYVIDELKTRVPIWKQEHYLDGTREWIACHHCGRHATVTKPTSPACC